MIDAELRRLERIVELGRAVRAARETYETYKTHSATRLDQMRGAVIAAEEAYEKATSGECNGQVAA